MRDELCDLELTGGEVGSRSQHGYEEGQLLTCRVERAAQARRLLRRARCLTVGAQDAHGGGVSEGGVEDEAARAQVRGRGEEQVRGAVRGGSEVPSEHGQQGALGGLREVGQPPCAVAVRREADERRGVEHGCEHGAAVGQRHDLVPRGLDGLLRGVSGGEGQGCGGGVRAGQGC